MNRKIFYTIFLLLTIAFTGGMGIEKVFAENIDPDNDDSQYAYGENVGWLNFEPNGNGGDGAGVTDSQVTSYVWAENIGWINLSPVSYGGVANDGAGNLSGYAWGENVGWINFAPTGAGGSVTVGSDGVFDGWAWGENIGWIHLKNLAIPYKVKTAWTPQATAIALIEFKAKANGDGSVILTWQTATETDNAGFNVYRAKRKDGNYKKLNSALIPSEGNGVEGATYSYEDTPPASGTYYYKLEDVDYDETTTMHGPVKVRVR